MKLKKNLKLRKIMTSIIVLSMAALTLVGCSSTNQENKDEAKKEEAVYEPVTVENYGREVTIEKMPEKILAFGPPAAELLIRLDLLDKIDGITNLDHSRGASEDIKKEFDSIKELSYGGASREATIATGADFIFGWDWDFGADTLDVKELEELGMNTYFNTGTSVEDTYKEIKDVGKIFKVEDKADELVNSLKSRIDEVSKKVSKVEEPIRVLVFDSGSDTVYSAGQGYENDLIRLAGGKNIFDDVEKPWAKVNYEEILERNPEVIIIHDYDVPSAKEKIEFIKSQPSLSQLECVKNENFIIVPLENCFSGTRCAETVELFAKGFYPELFK